ncbi:protein TolR [Pinisolibacter aquiterrae]|jgi:biopolymer transport protein TolR|uniref:protein TolR n=1 Tax=Pinisolibacter aquiterrae TaxID=2815579 RepID=UPI001C3D956D|nr:protein TolR [Pinisolibacter aquiterrae]MBV5263531.1 protein TolR [Pinisolibacter aquiterrae]MCC8237415.1 protein TolR [Pinisolibacter aquiterrae]
MGMAVGGSGVSGGRRGRRRSRGGVMSEMNMTPFIDVMLVLLIIFMVAAPMMTVGVPVDLPETRAKAMEGQTQPITVSLDGQGRIYIQDAEFKIDELVPKLQAIAKNGVDERILVRGDKSTDYGSILKVMGRLNDAGYKKIGLVSLPETASR